MKRIFCIGMLLCVLLSLTLPVMAAPEETFLTTIEDEEELVVIIGFDKEFPAVTLIDPDGNMLVAEESNAALQLAIYDTWAALRVVNPAKGDWNIAIDKGNNTDVEYQVVNVVDNIWIQYIRVTPNDDGTVQVAFLSEFGSQKRSYEYFLSLATGAGGSTEIRKGWATTGEEETLKLDLRDYNSYGAYIMQMTVRLTDNGRTLFDEYESEPFAYTNPDTPDAPEGVDILVDVGQRKVSVDWEKHKQYRFDSYFVEIFCDGEEEPVYYGEFQKSDEYFSTFIPAGKDDLTVRFYGRDEKLLSAPVERKIRLGDESYLQILTESPTASNQVQIKMDLPDQSVMKVTVGEVTEERISNGKENVVAVLLTNGNNKVIAEAEVDGIVYRVEKLIYKDGFPPMLSFFEAYDGKTYSKSEVRILGNAENAVKLYLNDQEIPLDDNGNFDTTVTLQPGENVAEFVAVDAVGNRTNRTIYLNGPAAGGGIVLADGSTLHLKQFIPFLAALLVSIVAIVVALILAKRRERLSRFSIATVIALLVVMTLIAAAFLLVAIFRMNELNGIVGSMELSHITDESLQQATELVAELDAAPGKILLWSCITGGLLLITIVVIVLVKRRKRSVALAEMPPAQVEPDQQLSEVSEEEQSTEEEQEE